MLGGVGRVEMDFKYIETEPNQTQGIWGMD